MLKQYIMVDVRPKLRIVKGIPMSVTCDEEKLKSALNYRAQADDIFLCVYPKSGTTWAQVILYTLMNNGQAFDHDMAKYFAHTPTLEHIGGEGLENMHRPYVIKSHIPFNRLPYNEKAKYVGVLRNPKDVFTSYYYFVVKILGVQPDRAAFDAFFEEFINGNLYFGDYFDHIRALWQHRDNPNVFITSYEHMKHDIATVIRQLARFLSIELDDELLKRILMYSSYNYMKERFDRAYSKQAKITLADETATAPRPISDVLLKEIDKMPLVRKGVVGDWSSIMTEEQSRRIDDKLIEKTADLVGLDELFIYT